MSDFKPPNYNLIRYEIGEYTSDYDVLNSIYKRMVIKYKDNLKELWIWFESLNAKQRKNIGLKVRRLGESSDNDYTVEIDIIPRNDNGYMMAVVAKNIENIHQLRILYYTELDDDDDDTTDDTEGEVW